MSESTIDGLIVSKLKNIIKIKHVTCFLIFFAVVIFTFSVSEAILFVLSYISGFILFYFILKYKEKVLHTLFRFSSFHLNEQYNKNTSLKHSRNNCNVCGEEKCLRYHKTNCQEPWTNLLLHKQLDQAIENFYNTIIRIFVTPWYSKLSEEETLQGELRYLLRYASSSLLNRGLKVNIGEIITNKLIPCALKHYVICNEAQRIMIEKNIENLEEAALEGPLKYSLHTAVVSRENEMDYLRCVTEALMPILLPKQEVDSKLFSILIREIFAGWVLLSLTDLLADPNTINTLVILATGNEKMSQLPVLPNHEVEFLNNFVHKNLYKRMRLLNLEVAEILKSPEYLYSFMQFMKSRGKIHLLQFCLDIDEFNKKMLQPEINVTEKKTLFKRAMELYSTYFLKDSSSYISFNKEHIEQFKSILKGGPEDIIKLQRSKVIYEAYDYVFGLLDQEWAPKFFDSYEFYNLIIPCVITEPKRLLTNVKPDKSNNSSVIGKPLSKLKDAFKNQTVDGLLLDPNDAMKNNCDSDSVDGVEMEMQYSDILANYARLKNKDMSSWRVSIEDVTEAKAKNKAGLIHWFNININKIDPHGIGDDSQWAVNRTDHDFHTLKEKLMEFHGESIIGDIYIPSKRVKAAAELRKMKYEVFLQHLLGVPLLKSSDLLHLFLTTDADFSALAKEASSDSSPFSDFGNLYQTVTHKLRKEKGQHLDAFLQTFLISTDIEYYQSLNEEKKRMLECEEEATDIVNDISLTKKYNDTRSLTGGIFENNFATNKTSNSMNSCQNNDKTSWNFTHCLHFILKDVFEARHIVTNLCNFLCKFGNPYVNYYFDVYLNNVLKKVLSPPRLGHLIKLGQDLIFDNPTQSSVKIDRNVKFKMAQSQLQNAFPMIFTKLMGPNFLFSVDTLLNYLQNPKMNKQLVYTLFDAILVELFPELKDGE